MMQKPTVAHPEAPDRLFETSPAALAGRFGDRARQFLRDGRDVRETVRLAAWYAFQACPELRGERYSLADEVFALGVALNRVAAERLH